MQGPGRSQEVCATWKQRVIAVFHVKRVGVGQGGGRGSGCAASAMRGICGRGGAGGVGVELAQTWEWIERKRAGTVPD